MGLALLGGLLFSGCVQIAKPESFFELTPEMAQHRALQTRIFDTANEKELLSASAAVLQDLGFQLEESAVGVGMLRAAKERSAREAGQEILQGFLLVLFAITGKAYIMPVDLHQQINATLVTRRSETDSSRFRVPGGLNSVGPTPSLVLLPEVQRGSLVDRLEGRDGPEERHLHTRLGIEV